MLSSERVALAYFAYLALAACVIRMPARTRLGIVAECAGTSIIVFAVARLQSSAALTPWARYLREWMPLVYLLWFYWIPAHFTSPAIDRDAERWLATQPDDARTAPLRARIERVRDQKKASDRG